VYGESEVRYLESLPHDTRLDVLDTTFTHDIPCVLITGGWDAHEDLRSAAERHQVPLLRTAVSTPVAISRISALLDDALAAREIVHGVLMDVLGLGVLIIGDSGIGKSECALDLVVRGHRLVADDTVEIRRRSDSEVIGACPEPTRYHMELRGLGIINVRDLFGVASTRASKRVELVVQLERWDAHREYDRLGLDESAYELFGVRVPFICMPVAPGRNLATLVEVAARNQLLRSRGLNAARDLVERLERQLQGEDADPESEEEPRSGEPR
jgi:HPr kinase/phosphorylase